MATRRPSDEHSQRGEEERIRRSGENVGRAASEQAAETARAAGEAGQRAVEQGADFMRRGADSAREFGQTASATAGRLTERTAEQFIRALGITGEDARQAAQQSARNLEAIMQSGAAVAEGVQSISREWFEFTRRRMEHNLDQINALMRCRTPQDLAAVQSDAWRDNVEGLLQSTRRMAELSVRMADEASKRIASSAGRRAA